MSERQRRHYYRELAPKLVENGYEIIPVVPGGKRPAQGREWQNKTATTLEQVKDATPTYGDSSIGIVGRTTPAFDFDIMQADLADYMMALAASIIGSKQIPVRYGFKPKFLMPGRWHDGDAPGKRSSKGYIAADADPLDPRLIVNRIEFLGDGQQWVAIGDHDKAAAKYTYLDDLHSPVTTPHDQLPAFDESTIDRIIEEFEWAAENNFGLVEYVAPARLNGINGHGLNGHAVYEPLAEPGRPPETEYEIARVKTALRYYSAESIGRDYESFIVPVFAVSWLGWECGEELILEWSRRSPWHNERDTKYWFRHPSKRKDKHPITISTLFALAKETRGWDGTIPFDEMEDDDENDLAGPGAEDNDLAGPSDGEGASKKPKDGVKQRLAKMIERFAVVKLGSKVVIYEDFGGKRVPEYMMPISFRTLMMNNFVDVADKKNPKKVTRVFMHDVFMKAPERPTYNRVVFKPEGEVYPGEYNLWRGLSTEPKPGNVAPWLKLLEALLPNKNEREYVLHWLAKKVQRPAWVPGTFLIFKGGFGIGKGAIFKPFLRIFGPHGGEFDKANQVVGQYNAHLEYTTVAVLEEAIFAAHPQHVETLKNMVTAEWIMIEPKGLDVRKARNHCAFINLTNQNFAWHTKAGERRAVILEIPDTLKGDTKFWNMYWAWVNSPGAIEALHDYLNNLDVSTWDVRNIPKGKGYREQLEQTGARDAPIAFAQRMLEDGKLPGIDFFFEDSDDGKRTPRDLLRDAYEDFRRKGFGNYAPSWDVAARTIYRVLGVKPKEIETKANMLEKEIGWKGYVLRMPSLERMREAFFKETDILIEGVSESETPEIDEI